MKWPLVWRKNHEALLASEFQRHEDHFWRQASLNITAQNRIDGLQKEIDRLNKQIAAYGGV